MNNLNYLFLLVMAVSFGIVGGIISIFISMIAVYIYAAITVLGLCAIIVWIVSDVRSEEKRLYKEALQKAEEELGKEIKE